MGKLRYSEDSWIGETPSSWQIFPAKVLFSNPVEKSHQNDIHLTPSQKYGVLPQSDYMEITGNRVVLNLSGADNMRHVEPGDYVSHLRSFQGGLEFSSFAGKVSSAYTVLRPRREIDHRFYKYLFKSSRYVQGLATTTEQLRDGQSIRYEQFALLPLPNPPLETQKAIADFLDNELSKIDLLLDSYQRLESVLFQRWKAKLKTALDPLTGENEPILFPAVPHNWRAGHLKYFANVVLGKMVEKNDPEGNSEMFPYLRAASIQPYGELRLDDAYSMPFSKLELNKYSLRRDDVVVVEGGSIGRAALVQENLTGWGFQNSVNRLRPKRGVNGAYLSFVMQYIEMSGIYRAIVNTSTISHLTAEKLQLVRVAFPQFDEQLKVSRDLQAQLAGLKKASVDIQKFKALLSERRSALIDAAVTGKIDVRGKN